MHCDIIKNGGMRFFLKIHMCGVVGVVFRMLSR